LSSSKFGTHSRQLHGGTLLELINNCITSGRLLSQEEIGAIVWQLAYFLNYLHSPDKGEKVVHRDLKPENIGFLQKSNYLNLKVFSFLCCKKLEENKKTTGVCGSVICCIKYLVHVHGSGDASGVGIRPVS